MDLLRKIKLKAMQTFQLNCKSFIIKSVKGKAVRKFGIAFMQAAESLSFLKNK